MPSKNERECPRCGGTQAVSEGHRLCVRCLYQVLLAAPDEEAPTAPGHGIFSRSFGDYEIVEILGSGSTGVVYRARHSHLKRTVALKVLNMAGLASPETVRRFQIEAEVAAALNHPNIVPIHEIGWHEGQAFIAMRLIEGASLAQRLQNEPFPPRAAASLVSKLAHALHYAHQRGVLHRDIKPANLLLDEDNSPFLADFGMARFLEKSTCLTASRAVFGTPSYMSPEQVCGDTKNIRTQSDIYSLGAVLYEMLAGKPPFAGRHQVDTLRLILEAEPVPPSRLRSHPHRDLETICLKCLAKEPDQRYSTAGALAEDLDRFLEHKPIVARPFSLPERGWLWVRRKPMLAALWVTGSLTLLALGAVCISWRRSMIERRENQALAHLQAAIVATRGRAPPDWGWSQRALEHLRGVHHFSSPLLVRDHLAASLEGFDAFKLLRVDPADGVRQIAFPGSNTTLFFGGPRTNGFLLSEPIVGGTPLPTIAPPGDPAAFPAGVPLQIFRFSSGELSVWNPLEQRSICQLRRPASAIADGDGQNLLAAGSRDGSRLAACYARSNGSWELTVWNVPAGTIARSLELQSIPTALALSRNGSLAAFGRNDGHSAVFSIDTGEIICRPSISRLEILSLAFGRSSRRLDFTYADESLLAVGDAGGAISIWDLAECRPITACRGSSYGVSALAFSPDRMLLASAGRTSHLWDIATGRAVLTLFTGDYTSGLEFSLDGRLLASTANHGRPDARVQIDSIQNGRGIKKFYGLASSVTRIVFSKDSTLLAAIGTGWEVGIWSVERGQLLCVIDVSHGLTADNCAMAFSPDNQQLAYAAGREAQLWAIPSAKRVRFWTLPFGMTDAIVFPSTNHLTLFRTETIPESGMPVSEFPYTQFQRVCRLRHLLSPDPIGPVWETSEFNRHVYSAVASSDDRFFAVEGLATKDGNNSRSVRVINARSGKLVWQDRPAHDRSSSIFFSSSGAVLAYNKSGHEWQRVDLNAYFQINPLRTAARALGAEGRLWASARLDESFNPGVSLVCDAEYLLTLGIYSNMDFVPTFDPSGRFIAWGSQDGSISVCDLAELGSRFRDYEIDLRFPVPTEPMRGQ